MKQRIFFPVLLALCLAPVFNALQAATRYVKPSAAGTGDGSTWANASADLQAMINASVPGDEVWVAAGTYKPTTGADRNISFVMKNGVVIYGGFPNTGDPVFADRNWATHVTTLSGDIGTAGNNSDNSYHVIFNNDNGLTGTAVLDGFTVTGGNENRGFPNGSGGGMYNIKASPTVTNCIFTGNAAVYGGGMYNSDASPTVNNCIFSANTTTNSGGAMDFALSFSQVTNCTFYGNTSPGGSVMHNLASSPVLTNCILWGNNGNPVSNQSNSTPVITYSIVQGGFTGTGNLYTDPLFADAANGNLRFQACSPAIDAGTNTGAPATDLDGNARPFNATGSATVDMGAYEYQSSYDLCTTCTSGNIVYVNDDASGANNGKSWTDAFTNLQSALALANQCASVTEIWVAAGTYKPTIGTDRTISFVMKNGVAIYGGFPNSGNPVFADRDWTTNVTTLSGDIDNDGTLAGNSIHVIHNFFNGLDATAVLDGFVVSGGNANAGAGVSYNNLRGGGVHNRNSNPAFYNCKFTGNFANFGAGMFNEAAAPIVNTCTFSSNFAPNGTGGGMYNHYCSSPSPTVTNCSFYGNSAYYIGGGGGMSNNFSSTTVTNCSFWGNTSGMTNASSTSTVTNCIFWGNTSEIINYIITPTVTYSIVQGGYTGTGNLDADPLFMDAANGNLRLQSCSPAIDAGSNAAVPSGITTDLDGNPRFYNNGTVDMGAYEFQANPLPNVPSPPTTTDNALHFDGVNDHVALINSCGTGAPIVNGGDAITIEYWFRGSVLQSAVRLQPDGDHYIVSGHYGEHILSNDGGWTPGSGVPVGAAATDGKWHHIAMTWQKATVNGFKSYLDGQLVGQRNSSASPLPVVSAGAYLGALNGNDQLMNGSLDNVRIWNVARTKEQIQAGLCGLTLPQSGLVAWYAFDHGEANGNNTNVLPGVENIAQPGYYNGQLNNFGLNGTSSNWIAGPAKNASRLYVNADLEGAGNLDGFSWQTAFSNLQDALNYPCTSSNLEIWVAAGTYKPTSGSDRTVSFRMKNGVAIYGGFNGTETELSQRNWVTNVTILSGDLNGDDVVSGSGGSLNITNNGENSYHVVYNNFTGDNPLTSAAILDGFTIRGGCTEANSIGPNIVGGGMQNTYASPTLRNLIFIGNMAERGGGGLFNSLASSPVLTNVIFQQNLSSNEGGGMYNFTGANVVLDNVTFNGNLGYGSSGGGGMYNYKNSPVLNNCTFVDNKASNGGGMFNFDVDGTVTNSVFSNNSTFNYGGALSNYETEMDFTNCVFSGNIGNFRGGGMFNSSSGITVDGCTFFNNTIKELIFGHPESSVMGNYGDNPVTTIRNSIMWGNGGLFQGSEPTITYSIVQGGWTGPGNNNGSDNPAFTNADNPVGPDGIWGTSDDGLQLQTCSPAVNAGDNTGAPATDLTGSARIVEDAVDLGPYENQTGFLSKTWYLDEDGDGYYTGNGITQCLSPGDGYFYTGLLGGGDCNDADENIHPGATELCNGTDDDCDGQTDEDEVCADNIIYVDLNATGANDGSSWANAYTDLQSAISDPRPEFYQIWVAQGTYKPTHDNDQSKSFSLRSNWGIYGGFDGTETELAERDWKLNETVLSGDIGVQGNKSDNSYHVVYTYADQMTANNLTNAVLDGFTITGGNANGGGNNGGGIFMGTSGMYPEVNPVIRNCIIIDNSASNIGGGICTQNSVSASIENCIFKGNSAGLGGALRNGSNTTLVNCLFSGNTATYGGGIHNDHQLTVKNCSFSGNSANFGGAIVQGGSSFTLTGCILWGDNTEIYVWFAPAPVVSYSIVQGGYAGTGNLNANPFFVSQPPIGLGITGDLHLTAGSPAIDAGTATGAPATDLDGNPRPAGAGYDMGAYEFTGPSCPTVTFTATPANTCAGSDDGQIVISGETGGAGPYMYSKDNGMNYQSGATFTGLAANTYPVKIKDSNNCESATQNIAVGTTPNATPSVSITASPSGAICAGDPVLFTATADNTGGGTVTYHFNVNGGSVQNGASNTYSTTALANGDQVTCEITVTGGTCLTSPAASSNTITMTVNPCTNISIGGTILWEHDDVTGVGNATVALSGDQSGSVTTPADGAYSFTIGSGTDFTVTPTKTINKLNGVTTADATRIQQHVANSNPITDLYKIVAADVNKSNSVTTQDASIINQALLGNPAALTQFKTSWRFVPTSHTMNNPPWGFPENITLNDVEGNLTEQNFFGIKTGDVLTPHTNPANFNNPDAAGFVLNVPDCSLQFGEQVTVTFSANQFSDLAALQFALKFDVEKLALAEIEPLTGLPVSEENFGTYYISEGEINLAWSQAEGVFVEEAAPIFKLTFNVLETGGKLSETLRLSDEVLPSHAYTSELTDNDVKLNFFSTTSANDPAAQPQIELLQNRPNPFVSRTTIGFVLPESCEAQLRVFDASGWVLFSQKKNYAAGRHEETLDLDGANGVLWYELVTPFGVLAKKMVAVGK